jgi:hypothetical protein
MWSLGSFSPYCDSSLSSLNFFLLPCWYTCREIYMYVNVWYKYINGYTMYNMCVFYTWLWYKYILGYNICGIHVLHMCDVILVCVNIWYKYFFESICIIRVFE